MKACGSEPRCQHAFHRKQNCAHVQAVCGHPSPPDLIGVRFGGGEDIEDGFPLQGHWEEAEDEEVMEDGGVKSPVQETASVLWGEPYLRTPE